MAQAILRDQPGVFRVLVMGDPERRAERLAVEQRSSVEQALSTIRQSDKDRGELFRRVYRLDWLDARAYDLCVCTDTVPADVAVGAVVGAALELP
jgi:cytidylate kinase